MSSGTYAFAMRPGMRGNFVIFDEDADFGPIRQYAVGGDSLEARYLAADALEEGSPARELVQRSDGWRVYHFHDTTPSAKLRQSCDIRDNKFFRPDGGNLAAFLHFLREKHPDCYTNIVDAVKMAAPFFGGFDLSASRLNENRIALEWREKGCEAYFGPESLSDGTLRFICLTTLLLQPKPPSLIIIDEPELGLHPSAIGVVAALLSSASVKSQVIACTQSVTLVNQLEPNDVVVIDREEGQSVFRRLSTQDTSEWLEDYGLGDLWEKNIIGGRP